MMTQEEICSYTIVNIGVRYTNESDYTKHSLETGFKCFSWAAHIYNLAGKGHFEFGNLRLLRQKFKKVINPQYLDIVVFNELPMHIGVMLDREMMSHCCSQTNGVARANIYKPFYLNQLKGIYRLVED